MTMRIRRNERAAFRRNVNIEHLRSCARPTNYADPKVHMKREAGSFCTTRMQSPYAAINLTEEWGMVTCERCLKYRFTRRPL